jgi:hypothetical protein
VHERHTPSPVFFSFSSIFVRETLVVSSPRICSQSFRPAVSVLCCGASANLLGDYIQQLPSSLHYGIFLTSYSRQEDKNFSAFSCIVFIVYITSDFGNLKGASEYIASHRQSSSRHSCIIFFASSNFTSNPMTSSLSDSSWYQIRGTFSHSWSQSLPKSCSCFSCSLERESVICSWVKR